MDHFLQPVKPVDHAFFPIGFPPSNTLKNVEYLTPGLTLIRCENCNWIVRSGEDLSNHKKKCIKCEPCGWIVRSEEEPQEDMP